MHFACFFMIYVQAEKDYQILIKIIRKIRKGSVSCRYFATVTPHNAL